MSNLFMPALLSERSWGEGAAARSAEVTPMWVTRSHGAHDSPRAYAHACWELTIVLRGTGELHVDGGGLGLRPGLATLIPPGRVHRETGARTLELVWIGLRGNRLDALPPAILRQVEAPELAAAAERIWLMARGDGGCVGPELDGLCAALLARVVRLGTGEQAASPDLVNRIIDYLYQHLADCPPMRQVAAHFGLSEGYFFRAFRRRTGVQPLAFLARLRMEQAALLLRQHDQPVAQVAHLVGYRDPLYFSRVFRRHHGHPPSVQRAGSAGSFSGSAAVRRAGMRRDGI